MAGDCVAEERRGEVSNDMFARFQAADRALAQPVKTSLARALVSFVGALAPGAALGLDVFDDLAADEGVCAAMGDEGAEVAEGDEEMSAGIGAQGESYVRFVLASMMPDVLVAPGVFAGVDPVADLLSLVLIGLGRDEATARDNRARPRAI